MISAFEEILLSHSVSSNLHRSFEETVDAAPGLWLWTDFTARTNGNNFGNHCKSQDLNFDRKSDRSNLKEYINFQNELLIEDSPNGLIPQLL